MSKYFMIALDEGAKKEASVANDDLQLWLAWKQNPSPQNMAAVLRAIDPLVQKEVLKWQQSGVNPINIKAKAIDILFQALPNYNPNASQLNTFVVNQLQQLNRYVIENQGSVRNAEHNVLASRKYHRLKADLQDTLGREPTDMEIKESMGAQGSIKDFKPIIEMNYSQTLQHNDEGGGAFTPVNDAIGNDALATNLLFKGLSDQHQQIFKYTYGHEGSEKLKGKDIAKNLGISPARVSVIQNQLGVRLRNMSNTLDEIQGF